MNINLGLTTGVLALLVFTIAIGGYYIDTVKKLSEDNGVNIDILKKNQDTFVSTWIDKQASMNKVSNETEAQLLNLSRTNDVIIKQQLENEKDILKTETNVLSNLTTHRHVANATRDATFEILRTLDNNITKTLHDDHEKIKNFLGNHSQVSIENQKLLAENSEILNKILENRTG